MSVLIERERELELVGEAVAKAAAGDGQLIVIEGPIGVGKSTLLGAVRQAGRSGGLCVAGARGSEVERGLGWGVVHDLFTPMLNRLDEVQTARVFQGAARTASAILDVPGRTGPLSREQPMAAALHSLYWLTVGLQEQLGALILTVDDVQWSDEPSSRWLGYLAARLEGLRVLVAVAVRTGDPAARAVTDVLLSSAAERLVIRPRPLSGPGSARMAETILERDLTQGFSDACHHATGGNPLLLGQLLRAVETNELDAAQATPDQLPKFDLSDVARSVLVRIGQLAPEAHEVAIGAAVLGSHARLADVAGVMGIDQAAALAAADALVGAGVLATGGTLEFVHPVVRSAIYEDIPPHLRSQLHRQAADLLGRRDSSLEISATHLLSTNPGTGTDTVEPLVAGAKSALARGAPASAVLYIRRAIEEVGDSPDSAYLYRLVADAAFDAGEFEESFTASRRHYELNSDPLAKADAATEFAGRMSMLGTAYAGPILGTAASEVGDHQDAANRLEAMRLAIAFLSADKFDAALAGLRRVHGRHGEKTDDPLGLSALALASCMAGDEPAGPVRQVTLKAAERVRTDSRPSLQTGFVGVALILAEAYGEAETYWDRIAEAAQRRGWPFAYAVAACYRSMLYRRRGQIAAAEADARSAVELFSQHGLAHLDSVSFLAEVLVERDEGEALELLNGTQYSSDAAASQFATTFNYKAAHGRALQATGDHAAALEEFEACNAVCFGRNPAYLASGDGAALALHAVGESRRAQELAKQNLEAARRFGATGAIGVATRTLGSVTPGEGGLTRLREAEAILACSDCRLEHARAQVELGAGLRRTGRRADARAVLTHAYESARACGGLRVARLAREELLVAGARPRRDELRGRDALTASELRVASMAVDGKTNAEIAQSLFVTLRTVETHLTHAYQKLGITGRAGLREGLRSGDSASDQTIVETIQPAAGRS